MKLAIHDYCGHPFPVQLSRELARRGHDVLHLSCPSFVTPKGALEVSDSDPSSLRIEGIRLDRPFNKYRALARLSQEREYGTALSRRVLEFHPDVVISAQAPLLSEKKLLGACRYAGIPVVHWLQDLLGLGVRNVLTRKSRLLGPIGQVFVRLENRLLRESAAVIAISDDFRDVIAGAGVDPHRVEVIENWAPLNDVPVRPRDNAWRQRQGFGDRLVMLYAGTLGLKHDPDLLVRLALSLRDRPEACVVVVSEGPGADWLRTQVHEHSLENLFILDFQPYELLPDMLGAADVLLVLLEPDASIFSVPSKVLTYLCAGRPILASMPPENLATRVIQRSGGGVTADPRNTQDFVAIGTDLLNDEALRQKLGHNAREYAERVFDIDTIASRFEQLLTERAHAEPERGSQASRVS